MRHTFATLEDAMSCARVLVKPIIHPEPSPSRSMSRPLCRVESGTVKYKPVDRTAALVVSKAPDWAKPPLPPPVFPEKPKPPKINLQHNNQPQHQHQHQPNRKNRNMSGAETAANIVDAMAPDSYVSKDGIRVTKVNGEIHMNMDDMRDLIVRQIHELPRQTSPQVKAAEDARRIIAELTDGIGGEMEKFEAQSKLHVEQIRGKRMTMVTEAAQMTNALKEIRQFFLGSDYKEEISRLSEFVDLCERLQKLKRDGFLDQIADTMISLSIRNDS
jgi:hypothetical protein